ncbi:MAG TPA: hypothetical protein VGJ93_15610 [Desulfuromonadaceae bacterium]|jgi:hypothetical protein
MAKISAAKDKALSGQHGLFDSGLLEGAFDIGLGLRQCLSRAISESGLDRYYIAAEISRLTKSTVSKDMLDKYTSSNPDYCIRCEILTAFCHVVGSLEPFRYLLEPLGSDALKPEDKDLIELARLQEDERRIQGKIMQIRAKRGLK